MNKPILIRDHFENAKQYQIPRADLIICDLPYELGEKMYASNPSWYNQGDRTKGESNLAHKAAFNTDYRFSIPNFFSFATRLLRKEPGKGEKGAPCMIVFCSFQQIPTIISEAEKAGFKHAQHLSFIKKSSPQALKANMKICGATEHALLLYRDKLPKFNNVDPADGQHHMILDWFPFERDGKDIPHIHPTQKPVKLLKRLITIFTDPGDVVIDCCAGSGSTLRAAWELGRQAYGFEVDRRFFTDAVEQMLAPALNAPQENSQDAVFAAATNG